MFALRTSKSSASRLTAEENFRIFGQLHGLRGRDLRQRIAAVMAFAIWRFRRNRMFE